MSAELALAVAGEALGTLAYKIGAATYGELFAERHDVMVSDSALLVEDQAGNQVVLTDEQATAIGALIKSPEVTALAQTYILGQRATETFQDAPALTAGSKGAFLGLFAKEFPSMRSAGELIWNLITEVLQNVAPTQSGLKRGKKEDLSRLFDTQEGMPDRRPPAPRYIREILESTTDWEIVERLRRICEDACRAAEEEFGKMHLEHAQDNHRFSHEDLYIERTLIPRESNRKKRVESTVITAPAPGTNAVVIGNPGAGKSTLVRKAIYQQIKRPTRDLAPIVLLCRELNSESDFDLTRELTNRLGLMPGVELKEGDFERLLSLGRALLVFDGIDEIADLQRRRRVILSIESLAVAYPLAPIICTTRIVGYDSAAFHNSRFSLYELDDFSEAQVSQYARRWFKIMRRPAIDSKAFLQDSQEVREIRRNPLMLSLLCTLYKVRGYIPMNRLDVYKSCADLLFYSWDSLRHIPQPVDHKRYGHTLMEELADLFFKFPSAGAGVEEGLLVRLIASFFKDTAGVDQTEAAHRAQEFLNFCAGRAWLLTSVGRDSRGQRVFAFTHRTFMEFYAARAVVRRARSEEDVLRVIYDVYRKNPSSVLPDIIVQAYDEKEYRGAETLLRIFKREGRAGRQIPAGSHFPLCLRILNSTPVGAPLVREILLDALTAWNFTNDRTDRGIFISLLQLYRDPRNICQRILRRVDEAVQPAVASAFRNAFLRRWSRLSLTGFADVFEEEWGAIAHLIATEDGPTLADEDPAVYAYLKLAGLLPGFEVSAPELERALVLSAFGAQIPGLALRAVREYLGEDKPDAIYQQICVQYGGALEQQPAQIPRDLAERAQRVVGDIVPALADVEPAQPATIKNLLFWLACLMCETTDSGLHSFHEVVRYLYPNDLLYRVLRKRMRSKQMDEGAAEELRSVRLGPRLRHEVSRFCPPWADTWMKGDLSITGAPY
ncbi:NACHT domain-containing protein [Micromonospora chalcea]|uniref:NACHT domain-containing protein n=1 Tax=Micromonospora TaxID=1873 RepID=UPI002FF2F40A